MGMNPRYRDGEGDGSGKGCAVFFGLVVLFFLVIAVLASTQGESPVAESRIDKALDEFKEQVQFDYREPVLHPRCQLDGPENDIFDHADYDCRGEVDGHHIKYDCTVGHSYVECDEDR